MRLNTGKTPSPAPGVESSAQPSAPAALPHDAKILVAGHRGLAGSAIMRALKRHSLPRVVGVSRAEVDLREQAAVRDLFARERPDYVFLAAARVGGILANCRYPADFLYDNLMIAANVVEAAHRVGVAKLLFLGSTCLYPRAAPQPMREDHLLTGPLEPTNEAYAIAKIAGLKLCEAFGRQHGLATVTLMPANLYGPGDNFDLEGGHVLAALLRKAHEAKRAGSAAITVWGTGTPLRDFLHADDLAEACLFAMACKECSGMFNVGSGEDISIAALARLVCETVGFTGGIVFDPEKPDGMPRKLADTGRLNALGWRARIALREGLAATYRWYAETCAKHGPEPLSP